MNVTVEHLSAIRHALTVQASWDEVAEDYRRVVADFRNLPLPGFRPGKVPANVVEHRFRDRIVKQVGDQCTRRLLRLAVAQEKLGHMAVAEIRDVDLRRNEGLSFTAEFDVIPEFELPDVRAFRMPEDSDEEPRDALSAYLIANTTFEVPEAMVEREWRAVTGPDPDAEDKAEAEERVRLMLILRRIAERDGIDIDEGHLEERLRAMAREYGVTLSQLRNQLRQGEALDRIRDLLLAERTIDHILESCGIE